MKHRRNINRSLLFALALSLMMSFTFAAIGSAQDAKDGTASEPEYATMIFGEQIISVEIIVEKAEWQWMLDNAISEEYIKADVIVNGTMFNDVGVRPKGNSSLTQVANSDSDRFSFRLQFDEYVKGQTCFGLDSFVMNNMFGDSTYMKEYISYELMREIGVDAPYFGYASIKVNGENWGLYLAVERYSKSYEKRVFGDTQGMLYNVKTMDMDRNDGGLLQEQMRENGTFPSGMQGFLPKMQDGAFQQPFMAQQNPQEDTGIQQPTSTGSNTIPVFNPPSDMGGTGFPAPTGDVIKGIVRNSGGIGGRGSSGGSLEYIDDNTANYSAIFDNVVGKGTESDFQRVVQAIEALSEGKEIEKYFEVESILRYLAAHTIVVNLDSYSSSMAQNYYIYEREGKLTILPWDYNLAWGGFQSGSASSVINFPIDTPLSGVEMSSRPLIDKLFSNPEYLEAYHSYLQQIIDEYFSNDRFEERILVLDNLISDFVENDPTAFCTFEEYETAVSTFIKLGSLRAQSVQGQLDGTIPSTSAGQKADAEGLVASGDMDLSDLGSMMGGRGGDPGTSPDGMKPR